MKILYISSNADEAGAPRHVEMLASAFSRKNDVVCIFGERGPVADRLANRNISVYYVLELRNAINPIKDSVALLKIINVINKTSPQIVHCHSAKAGVLGRIASVLTSKHCVYTVHGWGWRGMPPWKEKLIKMVERVLAKICDVKYIFVADAVRSDAMSVLKIPEGSWRIIYNGVPDVLSDRARLRPRYLTLLMAARVCDAKDHLTLLKAFRNLDSQYRLVLCGAGTDSDEFRAHAMKIAGESYQRITFVGETSEIYSYYEKSDIYLLVSRFEAFPISIVEAMAFGLPIVATNVGGVSELIEDGVNGYLVPPGDAHTLSSRISAFQQEEHRMSMSSNSRQKYINRFRVDDMLYSVEMCYNECVSGGVGVLKTGPGYVSDTNCG
jgi:glycosyltransferase involved in cell wall biosynthesis